MKEEGRKRQREEEREAVFVPRAPKTSGNYVKKHAKRDKGLEVMFDPKAHKEYLTGFHKRKVARRKEALKHLEARQRVQRLEERAERRQEMKEELVRLGVTVDDSDEEGGGGAADVEAEQRVRQTGQFVSTVTVMPLSAHSGSDDGAAGGGSGEEDGEEECSGGEAGGGGGRVQLQRRQQQQQRAGEDGEEQQEGRGKMSKTALRILAKTKLKVEGRKAGSGGKKGGGTGGSGGKKGGGGKKGKGGGGKRGR